MTSSATFLLIQELVTQIHKLVFRNHLRVNLGLSAHHKVLVVDDDRNLSRAELPYLLTLVFIGTRRS